MQDVITLAVFVGFSAPDLKEQIAWGQLAGFVLIAAGAGFVFHGRAGRDVLRAAPLAPHRPVSPSRWRR